MLTLKFVSDSSDAGEGFEVAYDFIDISDYCGEIHGSTGNLASPEWPFNYTNDLDCIWTISAPVGIQIELTFSMFDLEKSENCTNDYLEIR